MFEACGIDAVAQQHGLDAFRAAKNLAAVAGRQGTHGSGFRHDCPLLKSMPRPRKAEATPFTFVPGSAESRQSVRRAVAVIFRTFAQMSDLRGGRLLLYSNF